MDKGDYLKRGVRAGRSVEEIIVRRKLESGVLPPLLSQSTSERNFSELKLKENTKDNFPVPIGDEKKYLEKDKVIELLSDYCRHLEGQIKVLEISSRPGTQSGKRNGLGSRESARAITPLNTKLLRTAQSYDNLPAGSFGVIEDQTGQQVVKRKKEIPGEVKNLHYDIKGSLGAIDVKVVNLRQIFKNSNPMAERKLAITKINSVVRGWISRNRLRKFQSGLKDWKISRTRRVTFLISLMCGIHVFTAAGMQQMIMNRLTQKLSSVFSKWVVVSRSTAPLRRKIRASAESMAQSREKKLLRDVFLALKSVCIGKDSRLQAVKDRKLLVEQIRNDLSQKMKDQGKVGVVTKLDITNQLNREVLQQFLKKKELLLMRGVYNAFKFLFVTMVKKVQTATKFRFKHLAGNCFYRWSDWVYQVGVGLDRKRWPGPRKYEIRYNQKLVDNFARLRREKFCFSPWKKFYISQSKAKRMNQRITGRFVQANFLAWRNQSARQHELRKLSIENWKVYAKLICEKPFRAWSRFVYAQKNAAQEKNRIVNAYLRWKGRQKLATILKTWRHQALYGRIDGMYTRGMLINTLGEQKVMCTQYEKMLSAQTLELESCKNLLQGEIEKRHTLEDQLHGLELEINKHKMVEHHLEQERLRLESMIESMALINPRQVGHLRKMQSEFKFRKRKVVLTAGAVEVAGVTGSAELLEEVDDEDMQELLGDASAMREAANKAEEQKDKAGDNAKQIEEQVKAGNTDLLGAALSSDLSKESKESSPLKRQASSTAMTSPPVGTLSRTASVKQPGLGGSQPVVAEDGGLSGKVNFPMEKAVSVRGEALGVMPAVEENSELVDAAVTLPDAILKPHANVSAKKDAFNPQNSVPSLLSMEDRLLLDRVKWLLYRFNLQPKPKVQLEEFGDKPPPSNIPQNRIDELENDVLTTIPQYGDFHLKYDHIEATKKLMAQIEAAFPPSITAEELINHRKFSDAMIQRAERSIPYGPLDNASLHKRVQLLPAGFEPKPTIDPNESLDGFKKVLIGSRPDGSYPDDIAKSFLAIMTFLKSGDVDGFAADDKKNWIKFVHKTADADKQTHARIINISNKKNIGTNKDILETKSWRNALLYLKSMYPSTASLTPENGLFHRIFDMRNQATSVLESLSMRHLRRIREVIHDEEERRRIESNRMNKNNSSRMTKHEKKDPDAESSDEEAMLFVEGIDNEKSLDRAPSPVNIFASNLGVVMGADNGFNDLMSVGSNESKSVK